MKEKTGAPVSNHHPTNITMPLTTNRNNYLGGKKWISSSRDETSVHGQYLFMGICGGLDEVQ
jgi:hypothetical protein